MEPAVTSSPHRWGPSLRILVAGDYQPCAVRADVRGDLSRDVRVVSDPRQLGARLPPELLFDTPTLSGVVTELTSDGRRPLSDVRVELDGLGGLGLVTATTLTDAEGRYVLCGLRNESATYLFASKASYKLFEQTVALSGSTTSWISSCSDERILFVTFRSRSECNRRHHAHFTSPARQSLTTVNGGSTRSTIVFTRNRPSGTECDGSSRR